MVILRISTRLLNIEYKRINKSLDLLKLLLSRIHRTTFLNKNKYFYGKFCFFQKFKSKAFIFKKIYGPFKRDTYFKNLVVNFKKKDKFLQFFYPGPYF
jgi:hypothetical protein